MKKTICKNCEEFENCSQNNYKDNGRFLPIMSFVSQQTMFYYNTVQNKVTLDYESYIELPNKVTILMGHMRNELNIIQEKKMREPN